MRTLIAPPTNIHPKKKLKEKRKLTKKKRSARREGDLDKVVVSNKPPIFLRAKEVSFYKCFSAARKPFLVAEESRDTSSVDCFRGGQFLVTLPALQSITPLFPPPSP
jgi:hypothetical protein